MKRHALLLAFLFAFFVSSSGLCATPVADSTSFDPTAVAVKAQSLGGIPVGTIISWPVAQNPDDFSNSDGTFNWLECNGQNFDTTVYPELFALVGPSVPDLRGRVTWGSSNPGQFLSPGLPNVWATFGLLQQGGATAGGAAIQGYVYYPAAVNASWGTNVLTGLDASRCSSIYGNSTTVQPPSYTVRYLVRARP